MEKIASTPIIEVKVVAKRLLARKSTTAKYTSAKLRNKVSEKENRKMIINVKPKINVVRDSFTMPQSDYSKIGELKLACQKAGLQVKKSELLRAGLHVLGKLSTVQLKKMVAQIEHVKTGRPKGELVSA